MNARSTSSPFLLQRIAYKTVRTKIFCVTKNFFLPSNYQLFSLNFVNFLSRFSIKFWRNFRGVPPPQNPVFGVSLVRYGKPVFGSSLLAWSGKSGVKNPFFEEFSIWTKPMTRFCVLDEIYFFWGFFFTGNPKKCQNGTFGATFGPKFYPPKSIGIEDKKMKKLTQKVMYANEVRTHAYAVVPSVPLFYMRYPSLLTSLQPRLFTVCINFFIVCKHFFVVCIKFFFVLS